MDRLKLRLAVYFGIMEWSRIVIGQFLVFGGGFCLLGKSYWTVPGVWMGFLSIREELLDSSWRLDRAFVH
ncbi:hypothetical protein X953_07550 [Virgibacillus sp. SK37]|nr:hypothetical protein X953_07550 [Virgibacillus sp. SK37]